MCEKVKLHDFMTLFGIPLSPAGFFSLNLLIVDMIDRMSISKVSLPTSKTDNASGGLKTDLKCSAKWSATSLLSVITVSPSIKAFDIDDCISLEILLYREYKL